MGDQQKPVNGTLAVQNFFTAEKVLEKFKAMLGEKAQGFITSVLQIVNGNDKLQQADPLTIYNAAATAATMDLPINQNLGFAWIVPYAGKAQFQMGYKGFIQLAMRSAQYKRLNALPVHVNQFISWNELTETLEADLSIEPDDLPPVGYVCLFELLNGFTKVCYWSAARVKKHAKKYSKSYDHKDGRWNLDFDAMAMKTIIKHTLSKWGILSVEMQLAVKVDQAVIKDDEAVDVEYIDNAGETAVEKGERALSATAKAIQGQQAAAKADPK